MKSRTTVSIFPATALVLAASSAFAQERKQQGGARPQERAQVERGQRDFDRDRMRQRDRAGAPSQDRDRDRTHAPDEQERGRSARTGVGNGERHCTGWRASVRHDHNRKQAE